MNRSLNLAADDFGASPTTAMTHLAVQEQLDGRAVEWMEKVTVEQYGAPGNQQPQAHPRTQADVG